jgi:hypothetical protein
MAGQTGTRAPGVSGRFGHRRGYQELLSRSRRHAVTNQEHPPGRHLTRVQKQALRDHRVAKDRWRRSTVCRRFQRVLAGAEVAASIAAVHSLAMPLDANSRREGRSGSLVLVGGRWKSLEPLAVAGVAVLVRCTGQRGGVDRASAFSRICRSRLIRSMRSDPAR